MDRTLLLAPGQEVVQDPRPGGRGMRQDDVHRKTEIQSCREWVETHGRVLCRDGSLSHELELAVMGAEKYET